MAINTDAVQRLYVAYFNRPSDPIGQAYWESKLPATAATQAQLTTLAAGFSGSAEYAALYAGQSNAQIVNNLYLNLFGRAAEPAGLTSWANALTAGTQTFASIALQLTYSAQGTDATAIANKLAAANAFTAAIDTTAEITGYSGTAAAASARTWLATVTDVAATLTAATVPATLNAAVSTATAAGTSSTGTTFTLTTAIDIISGTANDDTILGDFTATATLNAGDQINGGAGNDTLKMYGTFATANMPISVTNVETLEVVTAANANLDLTNWGKSTTGISTVKVDDASALNAKTITTTAGQALSLATAGNVGTAGAVTWAGSATDTSLNLTLNGYQGVAGGTPLALTITGAAATTQNLASTGAANKVTTLTLGAVTNKLVITGDQALTVSTDTVSSGGATILKTVDASATTGGVSLTFAAATNAAFAFTGGSGNDTVSFADNEMGTLTAGSQLDGGAGTADKIGLLDTAISTAEYTAINATKNFEVLGLNAAVTVDASQLTSIKSFSLDTNAAQIIANMATGSSVAVTAAHAAAVTLGGAVGVNDVSISIGKAGSAGFTVGGNVTVGQTNVALSSNGDNTVVNTVTALLNADNSTYTVTGSNDLTISSMIATTTGSKIDGSALTGKLNVTGNTTAYAAGSALGDVLIGGSAADTLKAAINGGKLTGNAGNDNFDVSVAVAGATANAAITTITDFTKGDKITFGATAGAFTTTKVDLSSATTEQAAINLLVAGSNTDVKWGTYNGFTYMADDVGTGATMAATDTIVKLTGTLDLSTSTFAGTAVTFA